MTAQIPSDDGLVGSSVNLGQPFVAASPHKPLSKTILALAENLVPLAPEAGAKKRSGTRWLSFLH